MSSLQISYNLEFHRTYPATLTGSTLRSCAETHIAGNPECLERRILRHVFLLVGSWCLTAGEWRQIGCLLP